MTQRLPPLNQLRAFEAVARHLSFKKAAEELNVTRAAISHQIKALEDYFGAKLFQRQGRVIALHGNAARYSVEVRKALNHLSTAEELLKPSALEQTLRISVAPTFGTRWLLPRLDQFQNAHPEIAVVPEWSTGVVDFQVDQFDLAIRHGLGRWPNVSIRLIYLENLAPAYAPTFFPAMEHPASPDQFMRRQLVCAGALKGEWEAWFKRFAPDGSQPIDVIYLPTHAHAIDAAQSGVGIVLADRRLIEAELSDQRLIHDIEWSMVSTLGIYAVYPTNSAKNASIAVFTDWLVSEIERSDPAGSSS